MIINQGNMSYEKDKKIENMPYENTTDQTIGRGFNLSNNNSNSSNNSEINNSTYSTKTIDELLEVARKSTLSSSEKLYQSLDVKSKTNKTYYANIYVGLRIGYSEEIHSIQKVEEICQKYCDNIGYCVTVTETKYIYKNGNEPGAIIGTINYPRFPTEESVVLEKALVLAQILLKELNQFRVSIITPDQTIMLEDKIN